jgi:ABC-type polar amino acid transport system ATPase subunit
MGMTIVMVTHERHLAEQFADRLATMGDGKLLSTNASAAFSSSLSPGFSPGGAAQ